MSARRTAHASASPDIGPAVDAAANAVADLALRLRPPNLDGQHLGLYLATGDAGARQAAALWSQTMAVGASFANPRPFPWTLASSLAATAAAAIGAMGPVHTFVGGADAIAAATAQAEADLARGRVRAALVIVASGLGEPAPGWPESVLHATLLQPTESP